MGKALAVIAVILFLFVLASFFAKTTKSLFRGAKNLLGTSKKKIQNMPRTGLGTRSHTQSKPNLYWDNPTYDPYVVMPEHLRDPVRFFSRDDFRHAVRRAGGRCEYVDSNGRRCMGVGELHGDHWFPHSRGGATQYDPSVPLNPYTNNLVVLCKECNSAKSNHPPRAEETNRIEQMRMFNYQTRF